MTTGAGRGRVTAVAAGSAYGAQGLGYAIVVTALPVFKATLGITDAIISVILLSTCVAAAVGSVLADVIAVRFGSRQAVSAGFVGQAVGILLAVVGDHSMPLFLVGIVLYGIGLGVVDASSNMQGALLQMRGGKPLLGRLYAAYTAAAMIGALAMSGFVYSSGTAVGALIVAATVQLAVAVFCAFRLDPERAAHPAHDDAAKRPPLPRRAIWAVGSIVLAAFVIDSAVSTWSSIYLKDGLHAAAAAAPLGYAAYQCLVLLTRLVADPLTLRIGRFASGVGAAAAGILGCVLIATVPTTAGAVVGFAIAGIATGVLVPIAFGAASEIAPERSDEIVARVNLFNYAGVIVGAVFLGLVPTTMLGPAFLLPAIAVLAVSPMLRAVRARRMPSVVPAE